MTHPFVATVDPARVPEAYVLHPSGQRNMTRLDGQMDVIAHTTEPMHPITKPPDAFLQQAIQVSIIVVFKEDVLSTVAPEASHGKPPRADECGVDVPWPENNTIRFIFQSWKLDPVLTPFTPFFPFFK